MSDFIDISNKYIDFTKFSKTSKIFVSPCSLKAVERGLLKISVNKIGRYKGLIDNLCAVVQAKSGSIAINVSANGAIVEVGDEVHGKFDFRLYRNSKVFIGSGTTSGSATVFCKDSVFQCGRDCMFSTNVVVQTSDQHGIVDLSSGEIVNRGLQRVDIGDHVWLGRSVTLTAGTSIGDGSIIATGAVVTGVIGCNVIAGGVPAKVIKGNRTWSRSLDNLDEYSEELLKRNGFSL